MYHTIIIVGNAGRDPEMRYTPSGEPVTNFSVAVSDGFGEKKKTIWFRVSAWGKTAESVNSFLKKGHKVLVEGRLLADANGNPRTFQRSDNTTTASFEITANTVRFLSSRGEGPGGSGEELGDLGEDSIPF